MVKCRFAGCHQTLREFLRFADRIAQLRTTSDPPPRNEQYSDNGVLSIVSFNPERFFNYFSSIERKEDGWTLEPQRLELIQPG